MNQKQLTRRQLLQSLAVTIPASSLVLGQSAYAEDLPKLDEANPTAKALLYVHEAADVDKSNPMSARFEAGQTCDNCVQIQGADGDEWRGCGIFPGKLVKGSGWCSVWAPKPA